MSARLDPILRDLERHKTIFDLDRDSLGEALMDVDAQVILKDIAAEVGPDGNPRPPLSEGYGLWRHAACPGNAMAVHLGHMKTEAQVRGDPLFPGPAPIPRPRFLMRIMHPTSPGRAAIDGGPMAGATGATGLERT